MYGAYQIAASFFYRRLKTLALAPHFLWILECIPTFVSLSETVADQARKNGGAN
jgi:hypothetical protein